jgi:uncharacterized protein
MKRFAAILLLAALGGISPLCSQTFPKPVGFVNDFADVISNADREWMENAAGEIQKKTGIEIAVVTIQTIAPLTIEEYANDLASLWQIGKKGEDLGLLIILAMAERKVKIEVGYGLEGLITDGTAGAIIDSAMIPNLKAGNYSAGMRKGFEATASLLASEYGFTISGIEADAAVASDSSAAGFDIPFEVIVFLIIFFVGGGRFFWPLLFLSRRRGRRGFGGGFGTTHHIPSSGFTGFKSSGFGGGGRSGGFGGFGGGGFGGGGASRGF